jgi:hypothetical protein
MAELEIPELAIAVIAQSHNPTVLNADFLAYNEIVPSDWEPSEDRLSTPVLSQVGYEEQGVGIVAQPDKVVFTRTNGDIRQGSEPNVAAMAADYVEALPHVEYKALVASIQGHVRVEAGMEEAKRQVVDCYVAKGPWCDFAGGLDEASVGLTYRLEHGTMRLSISPALYVKASMRKHQHRDSQDEPESPEELPVLHFSANFQAEIEGSGREERVADLLRRLKHWKDWLDVYVELVEKNLLTEKIENA